MHKIRFTPGYITINWCIENFTHHHPQGPFIWYYKKTNLNWPVEVKWMYDDDYYYFRDPEDLALFKLVWCNV